MKLSRFFILLTLLLTPILIWGQDSTSRLSNEVMYTGELFGTDSKNLVERVRTMGLLINSTNYTHGKHSLNVETMLSYGGEPSANFVRDLQTFSNIEAGFLYGFYQFYYAYHAENFWLKVGHQDINTDFLLPNNGVLFAHSSFGIDPVATINMPAPTYPVTAFSLSANLQLSSNLALQFGLFDGQFEHPSNNFLGLKTRLNKEEGYLFVAETHLSWLNKRVTSKLGSYFHSGQFLNFESNQEQTGQLAFYQINDIKFWERGNQYLGAFTQLNYSEQKVSKLGHYLGVGLVGHNLICNSFEHYFGFAVGWADLNSQYNQVAEEFNASREVVIEANFKHRLNKWAEVQYYFHYLGKKEIVAEEQNPVILALRLYIDIVSIIK